MRLLLFLLFVSFPAQARFAYIPFAKNLNEGTYQFNFLAEIGITTDRFDTNGDSVPFEQDESFNMSDFDLEGSYGWTKEIEVAVGIRFRQISTNIFSSSANETETITESGLESVYVRFKYQFPKVKDTLWALEGFYRFYTYSNPEYDASDPFKTVVLGDGGQEFGAYVLFSQINDPLGSGFSLRLGARSPGEGLATEYVAKGELALAKNRFALSLGAEAVGPLTSDEYTDDPSSKPLIYTGSSRLFNSINREWIAPYAGFNLRLSETWRVDLKFTQVLLGKSTDERSIYSLSLVHRQENKGKADKVDERFKNYSLEGSIIKLSPKKKYVVVDKGLSAGVKKGMRFDFFDFDYLGGNKLLYSGTVVVVKAETCIVRVESLGKKVTPRVGTVARGDPF